MPEHFRCKMLKFVALDLAADGLGQLVTEHNNAGILIGCSVFLYIVLDLFLYLLMPYILQLDIFQLEYVQHIHL